MDTRQQWFVLNTKQTLTASALAILAIGIALAVVFMGNSVGILDKEDDAFNIALLLFLTVFLGLLSLMLYLKSQNVRLSQLVYPESGEKTHRLSRLFHLIWQLPLILVATVSAQVLFFTILGRTAQDASESKKLEQITNGASDSPVLLVSILLVLAFVILGPLWEEFYFRGIIASWIEQHLPIALSALATALFFSITHFIPFLLVYHFTLGLGLYWMRRFHRNLIAPIIVHSVNNALAVSVILSTL